MIFFVQVLIPNSKYRTFSTFLFSKEYIKHNMHSWVHAQSYLTLCNPMELKPARLLCPWDSWGKNTGVVAITFFRGSSRLRDWTWVSCIAGRVFTIWVIKEAVTHREETLYGTVNQRHIWMLLLPPPESQMKLAMRVILSRNKNDRIHYSAGFGKGLNQPLNQWCNQPWPPLTTASTGPPGMSVGFGCLFVSSEFNNSTL